jgi:hypothetical protein
LEIELRLRVILEKPLPGVSYGLQKGRGSDYGTVQTQTSKGRDLRFEFSVRVKPGSGSAEPNFLGPFVQGPHRARFIYLDIGTYAGQEDSTWSRRLKIPLEGISWDMIDRISRDPRGLLETHVAGTARGGPTCGTVKPFSGWKAAFSKD